MKNNLGIKIFADGADIEAMEKIHRDGFVDGFTTNPTLMKKAGVADYEKFARAALDHIQDLPISFEVFSDDFAAMEQEARKIAGWGKNVCVKIPVTNTKGESCAPLVKKLSADGLSLNVTAVLTIEQVKTITEALSANSKSIISVFAGRIADTGRDPVPYMKEAAEIISVKPNIELLWASSRELFNVFQAKDSGCHIITVTDDILKKLAMVGRDLTQLSLDTVKMFYNDAKESNFKI